MPDLPPAPTGAPTGAQVPLGKGRADIGPARPVDAAILKAALAGRLGVSADTSAP